MAAHAYDDAPAPAESQVRARAKLLTGIPLDDDSDEAFLERVLVGAGVSKRQLGPSSKNRDGETLSESMGFKWLDRSQKSLPNLAHIRSWPPRLLRAFVDALAAEPRAAVDLMRGALDAGREVGDISDAVLEAEADGLVTIAELDRIEREAMQAVDKCRRVALCAADMRARLKGERD